MNDFCFNCNERDEEVNPRAMRTRLPASRPTASRGPYHKHSVRSKGSSPRTNDLTRPSAVTDCLIKHKKKLYPGGLPQVVRSMFYSVVTYRRKYNVHVIGGVVTCSFVAFLYMCHVRTEWRDSLRNPNRRKAIDCFRKYVLFSYTYNIHLNIYIYIYVYN